MTQLDRMPTDLAICEHGRVEYACKDCGAAAICEHSVRIQRKCNDCGGVDACQHGRAKRSCKDGGGASCCEQGCVSLVTHKRFIRLLRTKGLLRISKPIRRLLL